MTDHLTAAHWTALFDARTDDADSSTLAAARYHLADCERCRAEWQVLHAVEGRLHVLARRGGDSAVGQSASRILARLDRAETPRGSRLMPGRRLRLASAGLVAVLVAALLIRRPDVSRTGGTYLLLLTDSRSATLPLPERAAIARAFRHWTDSLAAAGTLVAQGALEPGAEVLPAPDEAVPGGASTPMARHLEGFFLIRVSTPGEARAIASSSPYRRYLGRITIRRVAGR